MEVVESGIVEVVNVDGSGSGVLVVVTSESSVLVLVGSMSGVSVDDGASVIEVLVGISSSDVAVSGVSVDDTTSLLSSVVVAIGP